MNRIRVTETSALLQIKIQYFLTDVTGRDRGNFVLFPGSHHRPYPQNGDKPTPHSPDSVQITAEAGAAAPFPRALWQGVAPNRGKRSRKTLIYCCSHQCFRQFDFNGIDGIDEDVRSQNTRRAYFYNPKDQDAVIGI